MPGQLCGAISNPNRPYLTIHSVQKHFAASCDTGYVFYGVLGFKVILRGRSGKEKGRQVPEGEEGKVSHHETLSLEPRA
jgi:hypothetical protein